MYKARLVPLCVILERNGHETHHMQILGVKERERKKMPVIQNHVLKMLMEKGTKCSCSKQFLNISEPCFLLTVLKKVFFTLPSTVFD